MLCSAFGAAKRTLWAGIVLLCSTGAVFGGEESACYYYQPHSAAIRRPLYQGYELSLGPTPNAREEPERACTAAIYSRGGRVVFRTTGFNVVFDEEGTGRDFDGDGKPEVVLKADPAGGNSCCWAYHIISLSPKPRELAEIMATGAVRFEKDRRGRTVIWVRSPGPSGFTTSAGRPFAERVLWLSGPKLVDVTPEFCSWIFSSANRDYTYQNENLTPENIKWFRANPENRDTEEIASALMARALQNVFCRQDQEALKHLELWPEPTRAEMKAEFAESIDQDYPDFAARLRRFSRK